MRKELKKWIIVLTLGLLLEMMTMSAIAAIAGEYTFRKTIWGMNKEQVKETEKEIVFDYEIILGYEDRILELDCSLIYFFEGEKLVRAKYVIDEEHSNKNQYITDYNTLKAALSKKYGEPLKSNRRWVNDLYEDDPQNWGLAISMGHMWEHTNWETLQTTILLAMYGYENEISLVIEYNSKEFKELKEKKKEKEALDLLWVL